MVEDGLTVNLEVLEQLTAGHQQKFYSWKKKHLNQTFISSAPAVYDVSNLEDLRNK